MLRLVCVALLAALPLHAGERVALLIGNADYSTPGMSLRNPVNDVDALGEALRGLGFAVTEVTDRDGAAMAQAVETFGRDATGAEMAVFFYAGHGVQISGENHLIGTDFSGGDLGALRRSSITMGRVRDAISRAGPEIGILILDACRNNPFSERGLVERGLVRARGGAGLLIAYATDPGNVAYDGLGENSVFTAGLLDHIGTPGLDARLMLGRVRQQVVLETQGRQVPWVEESVLSEHSFAAALPAEEAPDDATAAELARWRGIASETDPEAFRAYLRDYPEGLFAGFARDRIARLQAAGPAVAEAGAPVETVLAAAETDRMAAALAALGLLDPGPARAVPGELRPALERYRRQLPERTELSSDQLYNDAARVSTFLAATTLQRLRTDIVALRSVERTLDIAEDAMRQIEQIAETDPAARPILRQAESDLYDIRRSRGIILRRLDQSRSYYDEILARAVRFFPERATLELVGATDAGRDLGAGGETLTRDAALFLRHVAQTNETNEGSYKWLADLIPQE
ncbi:caspase family protein [Cribrihabitans marinus]|uniref:caspase family protein n=1 Tax=Cribrihabitans marinus TaxID=1227549 RepID=UPI0015A6CF04|nr:caspase family protein [Cribrihabitans marinus]